MIDYLYSPLYKGSEESPGVEGLGIIPGMSKSIRLLYYTIMSSKFVKCFRIL